jgi:hypothetical protein
MRFGFVPSDLVCITLRALPFLSPARQPRKIDISFLRLPVRKNGESFISAWGLRFQEQSRIARAKRTSDMKMPFCLLALLGLAGCVAETPVTTTTTEVTRTVTTGPVATQPVTREVLVTQAPPPVRVETRTIAPGPSYVWMNGYWQWTGANYAWVPGHWVERPRPAAVWIEGHWVRRPGGWIWVAGHWQ